MQLVPGERRAGCDLLLREAGGGRGGEGGRGLTESSRAASTAVPPLSVLGHSFSWVFFKLVDIFCLLV